LSKQKLLVSDGRHKKKKKPIDIRLAIVIIMIVVLSMFLISVFNLAIKSETSAMITTNAGDLDSFFVDGKHYIVYEKSGNIIYREKTTVSITNEFLIYSGVGIITEVEIIVDNNGYVYIVWIEKEMLSSKHVNFIIKKGTEWFPNVKLTKGSYDSKNCQLFVDKNITYVAWETRTSSTQSIIYGSMLPSFGIFSISEGTKESSDLDIHTSSTGLTYMCWRDNRNGEYQLYYRTLHDKMWSSEISYDLEISNKPEVFTVGNELYVIIKNKDSGNVFDIFYGLGDKLIFNYNLTLTDTVIINEYEAEGHATSGGFIFTSYDVAYGIMRIGNGWTPLLKIASANKIVMYIQYDNCYTFYTTGRDWFMGSFYIVPETVDYVGDVPPEGDIYEYVPAFRSPWEYYINPSLWMNQYVRSQGIILPETLPSWVQQNPMESVVIIYIFAIGFIVASITFQKEIKTAKEEIIDKITKTTA